MSEPWLVVIDMQNVFADPGSPWHVPRFAETLEPIAALAVAFAPRVTFTRFVAPAEPAGAWVAYYREFAFARQPPDAPLYALVPAFAGRATLDAPTLGKWTPELAALAGDEIVLAGVATDACVIGTALAAADAGVHVMVAADACAGADDAAHEQSLAVMRTWAPLIEVSSAARVSRPARA
jgi:nicotinamidase-related amidase